jgi:hypothetical protein
MLNVIMLKVVMLNVVQLSVVALQTPLILLQEILETLQMYDKAKNSLWYQTL